MCRRWCACSTIGQNPQAACDAPRWRFNAGLDINVEATHGARPMQGLVGARPRVDVIDDSYQDFGAGQFIWRLGDPASKATPRPAIPAATAQAAVSDCAASRRDAPPARARATPRVGSGVLLRRRWARSASRQGDHRQAGLSLRRRRGHAHHVPHAVRAAAVRGPGVVGGPRQAARSRGATGWPWSGWASAATTSPASSTSPAWPTSAPAWSG